MLLIAPTSPRRGVVVRLAEKLQPVRRYRAAIAEPGTPGARCPAPTSRYQVCLRTLPCTSHNVASASAAMLAYGHVYYDPRPAP